MNFSAKISHVMLYWLLLEMCTFFYARWRRGNC